MSLHAMNTATSGMLGYSQQLDLVSNNVANVNTDGFKRSRAAFADVFYQSLGGGQVADGAPIGRSFGTGTSLSATQADFAQGPLRQTGQELDAAISGPGFFAVNDGAGNRFYTRAGNFSLNADGRLVLPIGDGVFVEPAITVPQDATDISIAADGTVSATVSGQQAPVALGRIEAVRFVNPEGLLFLGDNLLAESAASGPAHPGNFGTAEFGQLVQGFLEGSNVEPVTEIVDMITSQRAFDLNARVFQTANDNLQTVARLNG